MQIRYARLYIMNMVEARLLMVERYRELKSISGVSRELGTSRQVVRKWLRRHEEEGDKGLRDRSRRPHISPRRTASKVERLISKLRKETGYGRRRLAWILRREYNIHLSENTMRHILRRLGVKTKGKPRSRFYPAHWAWEVKEPFSLACRKRSKNPGTPNSQGYRWDAKATTEGSSAATSPTMRSSIYP